MSMAKSVLDVFCAGCFKRSAFFLACLLGCLVSGCVTPSDRQFDQAAGANDASYHSGLQGIHLPSVAVINKASAGNWRFNRSVDEVWRACLGVASQYQAIVAVEKSSQGRTLCVIRGRDAQISAGDYMPETTFGSYYDQWLAIAVFEDSGGSGISVAVIDPLTSQVKPCPAAERSLFAQVQIQMSSTANWSEKFADVDWQKRPVRSHEAGIKPVKQLPQNSFELALGNWIAKRLRLELGVVTCPEVNESLNTVAGRLKTAAGIPSDGTVVHILGSPNINAFALPNGDIYVTSGLLDSAQSIDEVAAVLAHEIDHLKYQDVAEKFRKQAAGDASANALRFAWGVAQIAMSVAPGGGLAASIGEDVAKGAGQQVIDRSSQHLQIGMVEDFSADIELRADEHGCETLHLAGFNPDASLNFLAGLKKQQGNTLDKKTLAMSNFINMRPGLDERIEHMKKTLSQLSPLTPDAK